MKGWRKMEIKCVKDNSNVENVRKRFWPQRLKKNERLAYGSTWQVRRMENTVKRNSPNDQDRWRPCVIAIHCMIPDFPCNHLLRFCRSLSLLLLQTHHAFWVWQFQWLRLSAATVRRVECVSHCAPPIFPSSYGFQLPLWKFPMEWAEICPRWSFSLAPCTRCRFVALDCW